MTRKNILAIQHLKANLLKNCLTQTMIVKSKNIRQKNLKKNKKIFMNRLKKNNKINIIWIQSLFQIALNNQIILKNIFQISLKINWYKII
jgi:hypothetical protein